MNTTDHARNVFLVGLKNAHAMEKQALSIMQPQINRLEHYPDLAQRLQAHVNETEGQISRLESIFESIQESHSAAKDTLLSAFGSMAALGHVVTGDEVVKNSFANLAFENYEIAAYTSLITAARAAGANDAVALLQQNLDEEHAMAEWVERNIPAVTEKFIALQGTDASAKT
ncbi:ferritin-like domain-containing protein [Palleronia sp.]|uniref:ferritin-like domain-containing protein n=1 Tax=Palleronia sp. TaxID=1940284 RepID=UPI0035C83B63